MGFLQKFHLGAPSDELIFEGITVAPLQMLFAEPWHEDDWGKIAKVQFWNQDIPEMVEKYFENWDNGSGSWDITGVWILCTDHYYSPPKSLAFYSNNGTVYSYAVCREANTLCLPQGQMTARIYLTSAVQGACLNFRNQNGLGVASKVNSYWVKFIYSTDKCELWCNAGAGDFKIGDFMGYDFPAYTFTKWRVTWWNEGGGGDQCLTVKLERYDNGSWIHHLPDLHDSNNRWKDSETNRCGVFGFTSNTSEANGPHFDDIAILGG